MVIKKSICYAGFNEENNLKIGETSLPAQRFYKLRENENFTPQVIYPINGAKEDRLLTESTARKILSMEYNRIGIDHFDTSNLSEKEQAALMEKIDRIYAIIEEEKAAFIQKIINRLNEG